MASFKDSEGRTWTVAVNNAVLKKVRSKHEVDLYKVAAANREQFFALLNDPVALGDVLYTICEGEAASRSCDEEAFGRMLCGDVLEQATEAFVSAVIDFFPNAQDRKNLRVLMDQVRTTDRLDKERIYREIAEASPEKMVEEFAASRKRSSGSSTNSPESAESTPAPSPSGS